MKAFRYILLFVGVALLGSVTAQNVSNADFYQDGKKVVITYTLDQTANVSVQVSTDDGVTYSAPLQHVSDDVGNSVQAGNNRIVWDALAEYEKFVGDRVKFRITAEGGGDKRSFTVNGVTFNMIYVQGGTFTMGATPEQGSDAIDNEKPAHQVTLSDYYIGETEVTQALWETVMGNNPSYFKGIDKPVEWVSWDDCQEFIRKLNALTGATFRLPTEAEWEYAARGGNKSRGYKYSGSNYIDDVAWYDGNNGSKGSVTYGTKPVATKQANELGIYGMSSNVLEWCSDWYGNYGHRKRVNPQGPVKGSYRVARGGFWGFEAPFCRVSCRTPLPPGERLTTVGFRVVLVP